MRGTRMRDEHMDDISPHTHIHTYIVTYISIAIFSCVIYVGLASAHPDYEVKINHIHLQKEDFHNQVHTKYPHTHNSVQVVDQQIPHQS